WTRISRSFTMILDWNANPSDAKRIAIRQDLSGIQSRLELIPGKDDLKIYMLQTLSLAFWANGDLKDAEKALQLVTDLTGRPDGPEGLREDAVALHFENLAIHSALFSEM